MSSASIFYIAIIATSLVAVAGLLVAWIAEKKRSSGLAEQVNKLKKQLTTLAGRDKLTGMWTRSGFDDVLDKRVQEADRSGGSFCLLYVGLDNFHTLNDGFGAEIGDLVLREAALRLAKVAEPGGEVSRLAAGEFALTVSGGIRVGRQTAKGIAKAISKSFQLDNFQTHISCSVGISVYPEHGARAKVIGNAALAMRSVQREGGGDFCEFDPKMGIDVREQALMVSDLRKALERQEFELFFQPKIDAISLQVTAAEALVRWRHPTRGMISPVVFIPLAEKYGLIGSIGDWVIEEACRHAAVWRAKGLRMRVAVNISGYQMREDDLVDRIVAALARHGLEPSRFTCEITESVAMEDTKVTQLSFDKMRQAGVHVSIDDFGTGYSSLATLRRLPAAELKIDRAFVSDLEESDDARFIARSIVNLASALNMRVVAEGVETRGQCELLVAMGCDELQGFLFSLPVPAQELERMALEDRATKTVEFRQSLYVDNLPIF